MQTLGTLPHPDGLHHWIAYRFPIVDQDGQPVMIGINAIDVTEAMETKARLEQVLASGPAAIYTCEPGGDFALTYLSDNVKALVGWEARDFLADPLSGSITCIPKTGPGSQAAGIPVARGPPESGIPLPGQGRRLSLDAR